MKQLVVVLLLLTSCVGCDGLAINAIGGGIQIASARPTATRKSNIPAFRKEYPTVNLPYALRQKNWRGDLGEGSCVHATMVSLFRWQGRYATAEYWRRSYGNGEYADDTRSTSHNLARKMQRDGIRFAYTVNGDVRFLDWACSTRRGCGVTVMGGRHMVALVHFDEKWAGILDNNDTEKITWVPRETFVAEWLNSNGWAVTPVYTPAPPLPL
ncbi:MAG: hypothetical protein DWQ31_17040 [Planctomycetota bacterium]|nr:MAG: hypothetical protein DWQ31_17040 [Planctomycetota bacterium]REJ92060.1 MAG: hypothetical protein DWQ35_12990 [Planctomycetota bacterium]REK28596.1 MAG: hypothetical protein DWQ42_04580 [Planctomycetota bacterium]REK39211.1 MAG: hypothetical protein DWQ46_18165 [Planctomycetota bacterium]